MSDSYSKQLPGKYNNKKISVSKNWKILIPEPNKSAVCFFSKDG